MLLFFSMVFLVVSISMGCLIASEAVGRTTKPSPQDPFVEASGVEPLGLSLMEMVCVYDFPGFA